MTGLAYNATTRHLFMTSQGASPFDIWIADAANGYSMLGGFRPTAGGVPVLPPGGGASLEADCSGLLYVVDPESQIGPRLRVRRDRLVREPDLLALRGSVQPATSPAGARSRSPSRSTRRVSFPACARARSSSSTDTPTPVEPVPVDFTVLFSDVPEGSFAWNFIYGAAGAGVMPGCAPQTPTFTFCPGEVVTRRSMAGFIERARPRTPDSAAGVSRRIRRRPRRAASTRTTSRASSTTGSPPGAPSLRRSTARTRP